MRKPMRPPVLPVLTLFLAIATVALLACILRVLVLQTKLMDAGSAPAVRYQSVAITF
jgi:hypothetical protein